MTHHEPIKLNTDQPTLCYKRQELVNNKALLEENSLREINLDYIAIDIYILLVLVDLYLV